MAETDGFAGEPQGLAPRAGGEPMRADHRIDIAGNASGTVIAGNHNVVIDANGSIVNLLPPQARPNPERRERTGLLPRAQGEPVGREADLEELSRALREHGMVQLWGPPGVGKSALLRHAARSLEPGPDGVVFLNGAHCEAEDIAQEIFEACYEAPGYAPTTGELRRLMSGIHLTVYVDDAELAPDRLRVLADSAPDAKFVLASRERSMPGESAELELQGLGRAAGMNLLEGELRYPLPDAERGAAEELCAVSLGRPLLLLRAAGLARLDPSGEIRLPRAAEIDGVLPLLLDRLDCFDAEAVRALHLLVTLQDAEVAPEHVGALCDVPDPAAVCARLVDLGLATGSERGYRCVADVMPEVRRRFAGPVAVDRLSDHFVRWVALASTTPTQIADHARALEVVAGMAERRGRPDLAVRVARAVSPFLAESLRFGVWGRLLDQGQNAARQAGDAMATAYFTHERAVRCLMIGQRTLAAVLLAEAVVLWRQLGDHAGVDAALHAQQYAPPTPPASPVPETGPLREGPGATHGSDPGGGPGTDPGTLTEPSTGTGPGYDPSTSPGYDPAGPSRADAGGWEWADPGTAPAFDPSMEVAADAGTSPSTDFGTGQGANPWTTPGPATDPWTTSGPATDPTSHVTAHSSGAVGAGGTAAGGGTAAITTAATTTATIWGSVIAVVLGIAAAVVIGVAVYQELAEKRPVPVSGSFTEPSSGSSGGSTVGPSDELAGVWREEGGSLFYITKTGGGAYSFNMQGPCGKTSTHEVTGSSGSYRGSMPVWDESSCDKRLGEVTLSIDVSSDGTRADVDVTEPSGVEWECYTCGSRTWTRPS
ncbi:ATP-binding protein [Streptomyces sp. NPDC059173]|uniref:ATP-binding protein n=1 Tax=Streptomyces sp. NPDC059173 TaxID=3346756 RepID=UPI00367758EC